MQLLVQRRQSVGLFGVKFLLSTRLQLTEHEQKLVRTYNAQQAIVFLGEFREDAIKALWWALAALFGILVIASITQGVSRQLGINPLTLVSWSPLMFLFLWGIAYRIVRETVRVGDLINGRAFKCRSIMDIQEVEELLKKMAFVIAQMLEDMKTWGGREIVPVAPLIERNYDTAPTAGALHAPVTAPASSVKGGVTT